MDGFYGVIGFIIWKILGNQITWIELLKGSASGFIAGASTILFIYGISKGEAGPASALANGGAIVQTLMAFMLLG